MLTCAHNVVDMNLLKGSYKYNDGSIILGKQQELILENTLKKKS